MSDPTTPKPQPHHGYASWTSSWRTPAGQARSKRFGRVGVVSRTEARAKFKAWLDTEFPLMAAKSALVYSVQTLCDEYFEVVKRRYVRDGKYTTSVNKHKVALESLSAAYGHMEAAEITASKVSAWLQAFLKTKRKMAPGKGAKTKETANTALTYVKRMFAWAAEMEKVPDAVAGSVKIVRNIGDDHPDVRHTDTKSPVAWETVERTLAKCDATLADMIRVHWHTGMRPGELVAMKAVELVPKGDVLVYTPRHHKNAWRKKAKPRVIVLGPKAQAIVKGYVSTRPASAMFTRAGVVPYTTASYRRAVRKACRDAGVSEWNPNLIRHSYATRVEEQFGALAVQDMLGHANVNQQRVYVEKSVQRAIEVAKAVG